MSNVSSNISDWLDERRDTLFPPEIIRLAVVGSISSGKSFLIRDLLNAISGMDCTCFRSKPWNANMVSSIDRPRSFLPTRTVGMVVLLFMPAVRVNTLVVGLQRLPVSGMSCHS